MKKLESGRSMVEMLGVLAIIGVLSIGGIAGYVLSMNRYRANAILDAANKYASLVFSSYQTWIAQGNAVSDWTGLSKDGSKLTFPADSDVSINGTDGAPETGIVANTVYVSVTFPNLDICETALSVAGYDADTGVTLPSGMTGNKTCTEGNAGTDGVKPASVVLPFSQS